MLRFFRTLRQRLLAENRVSRYLIYALGEIALVMIGILLALQVNTWNEERKFKSSQIELLEDLRTQLINDTLFFSSQADWLTRLNDQAENALYLIQNREQISDSSEQQTIALALGNAPIMLPRTTNIVYSESTMEKIDPDLNMTLVDYIQDTRHTYNVFLKLKESLQYMSDTNILPHVDLDATTSTLTNRTVHYEFRSIKNNRELKNVLNASVIYRKGLIIDNRRQIEKARNIFDFIGRLLIKLNPEEPLKTKIDN